MKCLMQSPDLMEALRSSEGMENICNNEQKYRLFMEVLL